MLLPIKPICKQSKIRRDGTSLIFIQYCHNSDVRTLLNTGIAIPPAYWKRSRIAADLPDSFGNANQLNDKTQDCRRYHCFCYPNKNGQYNRLPEKHFSS